LYLEPVIRAPSRVLDDLSKGEPVFMLCASQTESDLPPEEGEKWELRDYLKFLSPHRMKAVIWKDFLWMWRNVP